jgi:hypothetical protein
MICVANQQPYISILFYKILPEKIAMALAGGVVALAAWSM